MESSELKTIIEKSGLSVYRIEKDLKIPNGTLSQVIKGTKKLPEKYEEALRYLLFVDRPLIIPGRDGERFVEVEVDGNSTMVEISPNVDVYKLSDNPSIEEIKKLEEVPDEVKQVKRPDISIADLL